mgnify:CR=1 FL=1
MQNRFDLLVADVMPIYMSMPRYSHNYALFYQLLDSILFTHHNTYAIMREADSEIYGPWVYSHTVNLYHFIYLLCFYFAFYFLLCIYLSKIPKILSLSDLTLVSDREGLDNP